MQAVVVVEHLRPVALAAHLSAVQVLLALRHPAMPAPRTVAAAAVAHIRLLRQATAPVAS